MAIAIVSINGSPATNPFNAQAGSTLTVVTNITDKPGSGNITTAGFPPSSLDGNPIQSGGGWSLQWGGRTRGSGKTLKVVNPNDSNDTAQLTLNDS